MLGFYFAISNSFPLVDAIHNEGDDVDSYYVVNEYLYVEHIIMVLRKQGLVYHHSASEADETADGAYRQVRPTL